MFSVLHSLSRSQASALNLAFVYEDHLSIFKFIGQTFICYIALCVVRRTEQPEIAKLNKINKRNLLNC